MSNTTTEKMVTIELTAADCEIIRIALACLSNPSESLSTSIVREVAKNSTVKDMERLHNIVLACEMGWE